MEDIDQHSSRDSSYRTFYAQSGYRRFRREERSDRHNRVDAILSRQGAHAFTDPQTSDMVMGLTVGGRTPARWRVGSTWRETDARRPGHIGISPLDEDIDFDIPGAHTLLVIAVSRATLLEKISGQLADCLDIVNRGHRAYFFDHASELYAHEIWRALQTQDRFSHLELDGLIQGLVAALLRKLGGVGSPPERGGRPISLEDLEEFVRSRMSIGVTVADLASLCDAAMPTFNRHFKNQIGTTPYQFVQRIRIQMACERLLDGRTPLSELALELGFADQSHLTRSFKKHIGASPAQFVRTRR